MKHLLAVLLVILLSVHGLRAEKQLTDTLREVVVTGTRSEADVRLLPLTVSVVGEQTLTQKTEPNILPTLAENVPGLFVTERGVLGYSVSTGGSGTIKVRGIGGAPNTDVLALLLGLLFEVPVLTWFLARMGILSADHLRRYRRHVFVAILILAAVITPTGDPFTLLLVTLPVYLLYELSILLIRPSSVA